MQTPILPLAYRQVQCKLGCPKSMTVTSNVARVGRWTFDSFPQTLHSVEPALIGQTGKIVLSTTYD